MYYNVFVLFFVSCPCMGIHVSVQNNGGFLPGIYTRLFLFSFFPCPADHERDWPPCKVVFLGLATNALNVRNNNN